MLYRLGSRGSGGTKTEDGGKARPGGEGAVPLVRKNRALALGLGAVVLSSLVSWGAASRIRSPAEVAARTAPPEASPIAVPVERKILSSDVVARGTVRYGAPQNVLLPASTIRRGTPILTTAPVKGQDLSEGSLAFTISGRPALVLQGSVPAHRDITPGTVGDDVRQLQEALARLGYHPGRTDGVYDDRTGLAVAAWYTKGGWSPIGPSEEQLSAMRSAEADWFGAATDLIAAEEALTAARNDQEIARQRAAAAAAAARAGSQPPPAHPSSPDQRASSRAEQDRVSAHVRLQNAKKALARAEEEDRAAQARLDEARTRRPPPSKEEYAALNKRAQDASARLSAAREEHTAAQEAYNAANDSAGAGGSQAEPFRPDPQLQIDAAAAAGEVRKAADAVAFAKKKVALASRRANSGLTGAKLGVQIPAGELLFFPSLPVRVDEAKLNIGEEAVGPVMTVTSSRLVVESALSAADAKLVKEGDAVAIRVTDSDVETTGTVTHMATAPGTHGVDAQRYYLEVTPDGLDVSLAGAAVVQTISVRTTEGEVLAVPVAALSMTADGTTRVQVQGADGSTRQVTVAPGLSAKGLVAVDPVEGELRPGDLVVVGATGAAKGAEGGGKN